MKKMLRACLPVCDWRGLIGLAVPFLALLVGAVSSNWIHAGWIGIIGLFCGVGVWFFLAKVKKYEFLLNAAEREKRHLQYCLQQTRENSFALEEQHNALLKQSPEAVVIHRGGIVLYLNEAASELFAVQPGVQLLGSPLRELVHSDCRNDEILRWNSEADFDEKPKSHESRYLRLDGQAMLVEVVHQQIRLAGWVAMQSYFRDITLDRENALKLARLEKTHRTLRTAIERHALVLKTDVDGNVTYANDPFVMLCGYPCEQLIGKAYTLLRSPVQDHKIWKVMWSQVSTGRAWEGELCLQKRNGTQKWVKALFSPFFDELGVIESYTILLTDITEFVQAKQLARDRLLGPVAS